MRNIGQISSLRVSHNKIHRKIFLLFAFYNETKQGFSADEFFFVWKLISSQLATRMRCIYQFFLWEKKLITWKKNSVENMHNESIRKEFRHKFNRSKNLHQPIQLMAYSRFYIIGFHFFSISIDFHIVFINLISSLWKDRT